MIGHFPEVFEVVEHAMGLEPAMRGEAEANSAAGNQCQGVFAGLWEALPGPWT